MKNVFITMEKKYGVMSVVFYSNLISAVLNSIPYTVFSSIISRACKVVMSDQLVIVESFLILASECLVMLIYKKFKKIVHKCVPILLTVDLVLFWSMAINPSLDLRYFAIISTIDGVLVLGLYQQCVKRYFLKTIRGSKDRHTYDNRTIFWCDLMRGCAILTGFLVTNWPIQRMLLVICIISTPGSVFSYMRYKWLRSKALEKK